MPLYVVKLGGSAITRKDEDRAEVRRPLVERLAGEIAAAQETGVQLVLVHGAGPFGHVPVREHGLAEGFARPAQLVGVARTSHQILRLGMILTELLLGAGLHPLLLSPGAITRFRDGRLEALETASLRAFLGLDRRLLPVLGGCLVPDSARGVAVASGDVLAPALGRLLGADAVLLGSDVDGVYDADPKRFPEARPRPSISPAALEAAATQAEGTVSTDVTGGMGGKLRALARQLGGVPACIFDLRKPGRLAALLRGERPGGTWIEG